MNKQKPTDHGSRLARQVFEIRHNAPTVVLKESELAALIALGIIQHQRAEEMPHQTIAQHLTRTHQDGPGRTTKTAAEEITDRLNAYRQNRNATNSTADPNDGTTSNPASRDQDRTTDGAFSKKAGRP